MPGLPPAFLDTPIAHRALHGGGAQCPENSRKAMLGALADGFGIEIDLQMTADGEAVVFHDRELSRLTGERGMVRGKRLSELAELPLLGGDGECVPSLREALDIIAGHVPVLLEIKDQGKAFGPVAGQLEASVARALESYAGPVAVMSFNPHSIKVMATLAPDVPRGLVTQADSPTMRGLADPDCAQSREGSDFGRIGASFLNHHCRDLSNPRVQALRASGVPVLSWTVRSRDTEAGIRRKCDNFLFEGYLPMAGTG